MSHRTMLAAALAFLLPAVASGQSLYEEDRPSWIVFANGGGYTPLNDFNSSGTASLKAGWSVGGGAGIQVNRYLALRATLDYARAKGDDGSIAFEGQTLRHWFYGGDLQLRYPTASGLAPYLLVGAGAVTIDGKDTPTLPNSFTKFAGKAGLGLEYNLPSGLGLFVQGATYIYNFDRGGFDKNQADLVWSGGLSYRLQ